VNALEGILTLAFGAQVLRITVPYALAALGGVTTERSGVVDLALEGKLLVAALVAAIAAHATGSPLVGALAGAAAGVAVAALQGLVVLGFRADPIVAGVAINLLAAGATRFLLKLVFDSTANSPPVPGFDGLAANPLLWLALLAPLGLHAVLRGTRFGLRLRAVGEHPEAARSLGVGVGSIRWRALALGGALAGLGGAWLALDNHGFVADMAGGRGYIALAAVIMGGWRPIQAAAACLVFGLAEAIQLQLAAADVGLPHELLGLLPYVLTIALLAGFIGRSRPPASLGQG
jgi:simple sugar transport system permease protein